MIKKILFLVLSLCLNIAIIQGQDILNVVYYNILNFPAPSNTNPNGNDAARSIAFREIMEEANADIIIVEELKSPAGADMLLTELNNNSLGKTFARAPLFFGYGGNNLGNMLFYNSNLSNFIQQDEVPRINSATAPDGSTNIAPRANSYYQIEIFSPSNPADKDTLNFFAGHFKSSDTGGIASTIADKDRRVLSAKDIMDYITSNVPITQNIIAGGDFNFYTYTSSGEPAYDVLMNDSSYPMNFIDDLGPWTGGSSNPANVCQYTQSTRTSTGQFGNGGATGGLDDRFDFILFNDVLDLGLNKTKYIPNSYETFGSSKILNSAATASSSPVNNQLHQMSDHYPVKIQFELNFSLDCLVTGTTISGSNCTGLDYEFEVNFTAGNGSGTYNVVDITNGNAILATGNASPISVTIPSNMTNIPFDIQIVDANDPSCVGEVVSLTPINCSTLCDITITSVTTTCQADDTYDLEVCFDYQNPSTSDVNIFVDGQVFGPFPYPTNSGDCITILGSVLAITGDASTNVSIRIEENSTSSVNIIGEPFISEFHYDNDSDDVGEFVEITAPAGTDLSNYFLEFYNGNGGVSYSTFSLTGTMPDSGTGCGALSFPIAGIQNGPDGIALIKIAPTITVIEFISYEGSFAAIDGSASGMTSVDVMVQESGSGPTGVSLQKKDTGWVGPIAETPGIINAGLSICGIGTNAACFDETTFNEPDCLTLNCMMAVSQITPTCLGDGTYDLEVCFTFQDPISSNVNILVNGTTFGPFAYPSISGGCITVAGASLNLVGDATPNISVIIEDELSNIAPPSTPFISEIHYDNTGIDEGEFIEISALATTDLTGYSLELYNGNSGNNILYQTIPLSGIIGNDQMGCGALNFVATGIQNGGTTNSPHTDAIALIDASGTVIEFVSYEGTLTAANGTAIGMTSTDIGVIESTTTAIGSSLKKEDAGWVVSTDDSPGVFNVGLTSCGSSGLVCTTSSTYTEPNCASSCPINLAENANPIVNGIYQVSNNITSNGTVSNTGNVTFDAAVDIDLLPGFYVPLGGEFLGIIGGCTPLSGEEENK